MEIVIPLQNNPNRYRRRRQAMAAALGVMGLAAVVATAPRDSSTSDVQHIEVSTTPVGTFNVQLDDYVVQPPPDYVTFMMDSSVFNGLRHGQKPGAEGFVV